MVKIYLFQQPRADMLQLMLDAESTEDEVANINMYEMTAADNSEPTQVPSGGGEPKQAGKTNKSQRKLTNAVSRARKQSQPTKARENSQRAVSRARKQSQPTKARENSQRL